MLNGLLPKEDLIAGKVLPSKLSNIMKCLYRLLYSMSLGGASSTLLDEAVNEAVEAVRKWNLHLLKCIFRAST